MNIPVGQQSFLPLFPFKFPKGCLGRYQRKEKKKKKRREAEWGRKMID